MCARVPQNHLNALNVGEKVVPQHKFLAMSSTDCNDPSTEIKVKTGQMTLPRKLWARFCGAGRGRCPSKMSPTVCVSARGLCKYSRYRIYGPLIYGQIGYMVNFMMGPISLY